MRLERIIVRNSEAWRKADSLTNPRAFGPLLRRRDLKFTTFLNLTNFPLAPERDDVIFSMILERPAFSYIPQPP